MRFNKYTSTSFRLLAMASEEEYVPRISNDKYNLCDASFSYMSLYNIGMHTELFLSDESFCDMFGPYEKNTSYFKEVKNHGNTPPVAWINNFNDYCSSAGIERGFD